MLVYRLVTACCMLSRIGDDDNKAYPIDVAENPVQQQHLMENSLPGPYRAWCWPHSTSVEFVACSDGSLLVRDPCRNKGGLVSARMADIAVPHLLHVKMCYVWAILSVFTLLLTPFMAVGCLLLYLVWRIIRSGRMARSVC